MLAFQWLLGIACAAPVSKKRIGWAINTNDAALPQTKELFTGTHSWAAAALRRDATSGMLVFSDTVHEDWENGVLVRPCCGGADLGRIIATAQKKRELTWRAMLELLPEDTWFFVSTEEDTRYCCVRAARA
jgi:hypothetical protein